MHIGGPWLQIGAGPLAHLCSPPQTDVLLRQLLSALEEWREDPFMAANLFQVITLLHKAAHCTWPAGPVNDFMQRVLLLAVLCDIVRVERQAEAGLERPELLLLYKVRAAVHIGPLTCHDTLGRLSGWVAN